jgi:DNA-binding LytR/AlgR family response regulator
MKTQEISVGGRISLDPENIILLEADINYTKLYLNNGQSVIVATTLKKLEKRLIIFQNFFRSSKSFIVNLDYLLDYQDAKNKLIMQNQQIAHVSRRRKSEFMNRKNQIAY